MLKKTAWSWHRRLMQPPGELNSGLAGQLLYGVLIRIGGKCFIARKLLQGRELHERICRRFVPGLVKYGCFGPTPQDVGVVTKPA
jgi:hypothetical protein